MSDKASFIYHTTETRAEIVSRLGAAYETTIHYLKDEHRECVMLREWVKDRSGVPEFKRMLERHEHERKTLLAEARRLRWIARGRSLSERRREARAQARREAEDSEQNKDAVGISAGADNR